MKHFFALLLIGSSMGFCLAQDDETKMNNHCMGLLLGKNATILEGQPGFWQVQYHDHLLMIITDENHNRMRIISPVIEKDKVSEEEQTVLLEANFDKALDAKYAFYKGYLYSVFTHPLSELHDMQFLDALDQVALLVDTYGTTYTSSKLVFGGGE